MTKNLETRISIRIKAQITYVLFIYFLPFFVCKCAYLKKNFFCKIGIILCMWLHCVPLTSVYCERFPMSLKFFYLMFLKHFWMALYSSILWMCQNLIIPLTVCLSFFEFSMNINHATLIKFIQKSMAILLMITLV